MMQHHSKRPATQSALLSPALHTISNSTTSKSGRPPLPTNGSRRATFKPMDSTEASSDERTSTHEPSTHPLHREDSSECLAGEMLLDAAHPIEQFDLSEPGSHSPPAGHNRRNTGGTIWIKNTMTNPDIQATIKCVCGVYRAHIIQATERKMPLSPVSVMGNGQYGSPADVALFRDDFEYRHLRRPDTPPPIPSLADVVAFYEEFYRRSQMEHDTIIVSLIYVERLIKMSHGVATPMADNWRSVLFSCMVLASKVWDDLSMWNIDFSNVSANTAGLSSFTLRRINDLELGLLKSLNFDVKVPASVYAKYYFLIRTMLLRSGLMQGGEKPLGKQEAFQTLEKRTTNYQQSKLGQELTHETGGNKKQKSAPRENRGRSKSVDANFGSWTADALKVGPVLGDSVCLEQLIGCTQ
jgi:hypothetical protein